MSVVPIPHRQPDQAPAMDPDYAVHGRPSLFSGRQVAEALQAGGPAAALVNAWVDGVLTGLNMGLPETYDLSPYPGRNVVRDWVLREAMSDAERPLHEAALQVAGALLPCRARSFGETLTLTAGTQRITIREDTLKFVQQALIRRGLLHPPRADGRDSPMLRAALQAFQSREGLAPTGLPDPDTLLVLISR